MKTLEDRRTRLGLSKVALARILEINPRTVYEHERLGITPVWLDYCLRAIGAESELADKLIKDALLHPDRPLPSPEEYFRCGQRMVAHRLASWRRQRTVKGVDALEVARIEAIAEAERKRAAKFDRIAKRAKDDVAMMRRVESRIAMKDALAKAAKGEE
jgi:hypothetical protein